MAHFPLLCRRGWLLVLALGLLPWLLTAQPEAPEEPAPEGSSQPEEESDWEFPSGHQHVWTVGPAGER